ncbi:uncharacterized protein Z520_04658 [Fonsecaea multimorphosa CBS 102226]|uniref:BZIP domain-containing protein n=1 Tax=Fonsecaea multimorphosa CBS 102226 TaxID=1442371 RepID=A0A0D2KA39_9EURO|nr:uncharacterized protein Z520_04658 [Fonsecaea multimorphosa CBS 102226]KIY00020.1 hypothetical protein Z520_04658 [Fonsecaea multimorphosa CBS 102226]OAL26231.1 hypothetical protein AYO22_04409 [Fonsecaea multimorphosa]
MPLPLGLRAELKLHPDVQSLDEEWSGVTDPVTRRKLQNRLNQRAARRRKAAQKKVGEDASSDPSPSRAAGLKDVPLVERADLKDLIALRSQRISRTDWHTALRASDPSGQSPFVSIRSKMSCQRWYEVLLENRLATVKELVEKMMTERDNAWMYPLPSDHLISLIYYNVYRALISNTHMLGLDLNLMYTDDYPSPFLPLSQSATSNIRHLPPSLQPTELQKTMAHHPMWDLFPDAEIRDNILRYGEDNIDDLQLCLDMVGDGSYTGLEGLDTQQTNGLIVWGEPWDSTGWEVTEFFARKWPFLLRGAFNAQKSTNKWRASRGEDPLDFDRILEIE